MKLQIIQTRDFTKAINSFIKKRQLLRDDFDRLKRCLVENPYLGLLIPGTGGLRKVRLKAPSRGKSGGFRICYYYLLPEEIFLLCIYSKNVQDNVTMKEKKELKRLVQMIKGL